MKISIFLVFLLGCTGSLAAKTIGKAVTEYSTEKGMRLTETAIQTLELVKAPLAGTGSFTLPLSAVVYYEDNRGVFRFRDGWYKLVKIQIIKKMDKTMLISSSELLASDQVITQGVGLLRVAELEAQGGGE